MKNILVILISSSLLSSCFITKEQREIICNECKTHTTEFIRDSIYIKDTIVNVEPDSSSIEALLECDSLGKVKIVEISSLQGKLVNLELNLKNNRLKTKARIDTIKVHVPGNTEIRYRTKEVQVEKPVIIYKSYWWKFPLIVWSFLMTLLGIITYRKIILTFIKRLIG
jgi:hypothetical protein